MTPPTNRRAPRLLSLKPALLGGLFLAGTAALAAAQQPGSAFFAPQSPAQVEQRVQSILSQMTLDEKLSYIGGTGFFDVKPIPVPGLKVPLNPQLFQTDAGLGVRVTPASGHAAKTVTEIAP